MAIIFRFFVDVVHVSSLSLVKMAFFLSYWGHTHFISGLGSRSKNTPASLVVIDQRIIDHRGRHKRMHSEGRLSSTTMNSAPPPPYQLTIYTVYDETFRSKSYLQPSIMSLATRPNLVGHLEHHAPTTDGSFSICVANGEGVFISRVSTLFAFCSLLRSRSHSHKTFLSSQRLCSNPYPLSIDLLWTRLSPIKQSKH